MLVVLILFFLERKKIIHIVLKNRKDSYKAKLNPRGLGYYKQVTYHPLDKAGGSTIHL
jgi:hypothetical protein